MKTENMNRKQRRVSGNPARGKSRHPARRPRRTAKGPALKWSRILVPLDFSDPSREALQVAVPLAAQHGGKIYLLHVAEPVYPVTPTPGKFGSVTVDLRPVVEMAKEKLTVLAGQFVPRQRLGNTLVRVGGAYHEIVDAADELDADLIVIATHGRTGLKRVVLGSTAEHVVRYARCPVLTVRQR